MTDPLYFLRDRTPSGVRVFCQHRPQLPWIAVQAVVLAGARHDPPDKPGTAHLLEHLITMGNVGYPGKDPTSLYRWAVEQGFHMNWGMTMTEGTCYGGRTALRNAEALVRYLHAVTLMPTLDSHLEHEIEIIRDERTEDGVFREREAQRVRGKALFGDHPLSRADVWPEDDVLYGMTYDDVRTFHAANYGCENMALVVVGGMDEDNVLYMLDRIFKEPPDRRFLMPAAQAPPTLGGVPAPKEYLCPKEGGEVESVRLAYSWVLPKRTSPADHRLLSYALRALLSDRVREKACAVYSVDVDVSRLRDCSIITIDAHAPIDRLDAARASLEAAIEDDDALAETVPREKADILLQTELADDTAEQAMEAAMWRIMADGGPETLADILDRYRALSPDDVVAERRAHLRLDRAYLELTEH